MMRGLSPGKESGGALISALLLVAVIATVSVTLIDDMRFAIRRSANMEVRDQAYWHALGARDFAEASIGRALLEPDLALRPDAPWLTGPQRFPIPDGLLSGRIRDGNNCFNLNGLVDLDSNGLAQIDPVQLRRFEILIEQVGASRSLAVNVAAQAADWIDTDDRPAPAGAEDSFYALSEPAYRAANRLMVEREELLALEAMSPALYDRLAPLVCVRPAAAALTLNINTLQLDQAPLLVAAFDGALTRSQAERVLLTRPSTGYRNLTSFFAQEAIAALQPDAAMREGFGTETAYFEIEIDVLYAGQEFRLQEVVAAPPGGVMTRVSQRYGSF